MTPKARKKKKKKKKQREENQWLCTTRLGNLGMILLTKLHYNKMCPYMPSDFIGF
jgi:hypothetical protein